MIKCIYVINNLKQSLNYRQREVLINFIYKFTSNEIDFFIYT